MRRIITSLLAIAICVVCAQRAWSTEDKPDLNAMTEDQVHALPVTPEQADAIWNRLLYEGPFHNIFELRELPEIDDKTLAAIEAVVRVNPPRPSDERAQRIDDAYYRIENLGTDEGTNVGLVDEWIDRLMEPLNVNEASLDELMDLQNVSPADAVAIYNAVKRQGGLRGSRDLRAVPGLSDWGYRNARNYLGYDQTAQRGKLHGSYTFRAYNTPFFTSDELAVDPNVLVDPTPDASHKLRLTYDQRFKGGLLWHRNIGEQTIYANSGSFKIPEMKWFAGIEKQKLGPLLLDRAYLGNYQVSFGQGVVMESGDYFSPRYSGFGFDKRITGIAPDLSRAQEFTLRGAAFEAYHGPFKGTGFFSAQKKDAILNPDGSINRLVSFVPRENFDLYPTAQATGTSDTVWVPAFDGVQSPINNTTEVGFGGELAVRPWVGASIGFVGTEFLYDRPLKPDFGQSYQYGAYTRSLHDSMQTNSVTADTARVDTLVDVYPMIAAPSVSKIATNSVNPEATSGYYSSATSALWSGAKAVRQIYGINLLSVVNNYTFQLEYGEFQDQGRFFKLGDDPHALVTSVYAQWSSLSLLALYRDYSIGYDNPYCRGFSNYARWKGTTYEDEFYLNNPVLAEVQRNTAVPQAERGVYLESRYQFSRPLTFNAQVDNWTRVADQADYYRWVGSLSYRPVWPIVVRVRQKLQGRWNYDPEKETGFTTYENRINLEYRLSRYDALELLYASGYTTFTPRPRLSGEADPTGYAPLDGFDDSPTEAIGIQLTHYFSPRLRVRGAWELYDGFFWNFEDSDFAVLQGKSARWWFSISDRLSDQLSVRFKLTSDHSYAGTWVQSRSNNSYPTPTPGIDYTGENVTNNQFSFRIQLDYLF
jgi:DNA uptake protein ComE-like DNA-binding protein